jgi:hypothetical protein
VIVEGELLGGWRRKERVMGAEHGRSALYTRARNSIMKPTKTVKR